MSLSRTPSGKLLPSPTPDTSAPPASPSDGTKITTSTKNTSVSTASIDYAKETIATDGVTPDTPKATTSTTSSTSSSASDTQNKRTERTKIRIRERSISNPVLIRPVPSSSDTATTTPTAPTGTTEGKKSSLSSDKSGQPMPSTPPRLVKKGSQPILNVLTPEQQLASDLADLVYKVMLRKQRKSGTPGKLDDVIPSKDLTLNLQRHVGTSPDATTRIGGIMQKLFLADLKKSDAWKIASDLTRKIKTDFFWGQDESSNVSEQKKKERLATLRVFAANFAGAFFNVSGNDQRHRLPASLVFFLEAADHRLMRQQFAGDSSTRPDHAEFMQKRKALQEELLLNAFLNPAVLAEFFPARGAMESDTAASHLIESLHDAFLVSVNAFLSESVRHAPADVANKLQQWRIAQLTHKPESETKAKKNDAKTGKDTRKSPLTRELRSSPNKQQRAELRLQLQKTTKRLFPHSFTTDMLAVIKSYNNERAASGSRFDQLAVLKDWLQIISTLDVSHPVIRALRNLIDETVELAHQQDELTAEMVEIDVLTKLQEIESQGLPLKPERAQPLPEPDSLAIASTPQRSMKTSPLSTSTAVTPPKAPVRSSPVSPSSARVSGHQRSRTADVAMPVKGAVATTVATELTAEERQALIQAYPALLMDAVRQVASRHADNPVAALKGAGRHKFFIPLAALPQALRNKVPSTKIAGTEDYAVSHAELLKLLVLDQVQSSEGGRKFAAKRLEALKASTKVPTLQQQQAAPDPDRVKRELKAMFAPHGTAAVSATFAGGWQQAGLPVELLGLWQTFDHMLLDWATTELKLAADAIDEIRSMLGFDLIVTRLIYPLALGANDAQPSLAAIRFADAVREAMLKQWPALFNDLKRLQKSATKDQ